MSMLCYFFSVHVVFGHVISGQEVVQTMESEKTDPNSRPYAELKVLNCGELVPKSKGLFMPSVFSICFYLIVVGTDALFLIL